MTKVDSLRNEIIEKVLCINDTDYLNAINQLVNKQSITAAISTLTKEQQLLLNLSEEDILQNRTISQEELMKKSKAGLKGK